MEVNIDDVKTYLRRVKDEFLQDYELDSTNGNLNDAAVEQACAYFITVLLRNLD